MMNILRWLFFVCALSGAGCSAIGTRVVGGCCFSGVRGDAEMIGDPESIDPSSRVHPALAVLDMPFSFVGDILFLPYDGFMVASFALKVASLSSLPRENPTASPDSRPLLVKPPKGP